MAAEREGLNIVDPEQLGYKNLHTAIDTTEASIVVGEKLRLKFNGYLAAANVKIKLNTAVNAVTPGVDEIFISTQHDFPEEFDSVINATSYHHFLPDRALPFGRLKLHTKFVLVCSMKTCKKKKKVKQDRL